MQAIGMIETKGLLPAVESADAMLKTADVTLIDKTLTGGGLVTVTVTGEVAAVKAAVDAGAAAVDRISGAVLISRHVIPRPDAMIESFFSIAARAPETEAEPEPTGMPETASAAEGMDAEAGEREKAGEPAEEEPRGCEAGQEEHVAFAGGGESFQKADADKLAQESGLEEVLHILESFKVVKLRNLAREYDAFGISGRMVSVAGKDELMTEFRSYYSARLQV